MSVFSKSFPFVVSDNTRILIVGTMPGKLSLLHQQYYAHPRNAFWKIIFGMYGLEPNDSYEKRLAFLLDKKLGLWDTLKHCQRPGSLDSNIRDEYPNDFENLFSQYKKIESVAFNGKSSYEFFKKHIGLTTGHNYFILPSTSPANATMSFENKLLNWRKILLEPQHYSK